ncbi:hypothetical protein EV700_2666 [Fluviicoccus keumensis]|uniref:DUF4440 domain-containing protein n=1 Tax=Fluviicoccus keumensis TaxID=1435465 RepID=A0A4Q7YPF3_9GAMM|nr:hypothetical protein [Fluviicoccus keumensis]RZU38731.1 hypothetical protein EV700_2666 [Fluviicoccus keumensis]
MMTFTRLTAVLILAFSGVGDVFAEEMQAASEAVQSYSNPEVLIKDYLYSLYTNDVKGYQKLIIPEPGSEKLTGKQVLTYAQRDAVRQDVDQLQLRNLSGDVYKGKVLMRWASRPVGTRAIYAGQFRNNNLALPVEKTAEGWKMDARYWGEFVRIKARPLTSQDPQAAAIKFLYGIFSGDAEMIRRVSADSGSEARLIAANNLPPGDVDQILALCKEMLVVPARDGEVLLMPDGTLLTARTSADEKLMMGLMGLVEVPFLLKQTEGTWKVVPYDYYRYLRDKNAI